MKKLNLLVMMGAAGLSCGTALAQSKANAWEGAYGQIGVGYGNFAPSVSNGTAIQPTRLPAPYPATVTLNTAASNVNNISTAIVNLAVGYNWAVSPDYVLGLGASYYPGASSGATGTLTSSTAAGAVAATTQASYQVKNLYSVFLTPGYVIDKDRLAYAKVGYTSATIGLSAPTIPYNTTNLSGLLLGIGYKQMITSSLYAFGEFNYGAYGSATATSTSSTGAALSNSIKGNGLDLLVGVGYRF